MWDHQNIERGLWRIMGWRGLILLFKQSSKLSEIFLIYGLNLARCLEGKFYSQGLD
jgi:hypothetical protein